MKILPENKLQLPSNEMDLCKLDLNLFKVFEAVYSHRNLSRAAASLGITPPAITSSLTRLREKLGDEVFVKNGRTIIPTQKATDIIEDVRDCLNQMRDMLIHFEKFDPLTSRKTFILALSDLSAARLLPALVNKLRDQGPNIRINNRYVARDKTITGLTSGEIDFAIDPPIHADREVHGEFLESFKFVCAVRPNHPILKQSKFTVEAFSNLSHVLVSSRTMGGTLIDKELNSRRIHRNVALRTHAYGSVPSLLMNSDMAFCCQKDFAKHHGLVTLSIPLPIPDQELHLFWARSQEKSAANLWMRNLILSCHKKLA